jgi:predicted metal-dependent peptidase
LPIDHERKEELKNDISDITDKVLEKCPSDIPVNILGKLKKLKIVAQITWKDILRSAIISHIGAKNNSRKTYTKINKRTPYIFPGKSV